MSGARHWRGLAAAAGAALLAGAAAAQTLTLAPCRLAGVEHEARCGRLARPLDPARPDGPSIELHVAVLPALARHPRPDPVLFLAGGPGQSAIELAGHVQRLLGPLGRRRDLVLVDQRGTGRSAPLACSRGPGELAGVDAQVAHLLACRDALAQRPELGGPDGLRHFTTPRAAEDLDAVRRALGAGQVNLVAVSYGTRVALEVMRRFPQTVRRAVLDGVAPPDMALPHASALDAQAALDALFDACAADTACQTRHPALRAQWQRALARLPATVTLADARTGAPTPTWLTPDAALAALRLALYSPLLASALPFAIDEAAQGRWQPLLGLGQALSAGARQPVVAAGAHFGVVCAEDAPRAAALPPPATALGASVARLYERVCAAWPRGDLPAGFDTLAPAPAPVLLLSGGLDPVTPPRHGERVREALGPQARHAVVPNAGHGVLALPCVRDAAQRFVDATGAAQALAVDVDCARAVPRPPVWAPPAAETSP
ncbi:alpha/beta fold hydrolase [Azohydromonas sediminis]|uniref:alpha/beta fold hydrolase n=1 Tax=Azohydromonas sediminis TaxID=2259674 RepID=UPI000E65ADAB|nr:alpha/beta fold hydrolase [Azohydromonas sediminis]